MNFLQGLVSVGVLLFVGAAGWQLGGRLSSDAIGMALGVLFGVMAGIPAALVAIAGRRHPDFYERPRREPEPYYSQIPAQQPPVIVVSGYNDSWSQRTWNIDEPTKVQLEAKEY